MIWDRTPDFNMVNRRTDSTQYAPELSIAKAATSRTIGEVSLGISWVVGTVAGPRRFT